MTAFTRKSAFCLAGGVLALACSVPADAQFSSGGMGGGGGGRRGMRSPEAAAPRDAETSHAISVADALYEVRMRLLITQDQAPAWERFHQAYLGWSALAGRPRAVSAPAGALQSVQEQLTLAQNRFASTEDLAAAAKTLYAGLTEIQQQLADDVIPRLLGLTSPSGQHVTVR
ncbi:MAG: hypothetical protein JWQ76_3560 [Ramlibacter sp.]|nr:hypothetical protein [Ramlibacter sp.]